MHVMLAVIRVILELDALGLPTVRPETHSELILPARPVLSCLISSRFNFFLSLLFRLVLSLFILCLSLLSLSLSVSLPPSLFLSLLLSPSPSLSPSLSLHVCVVCGVWVCGAVCGVWCGTLKTTVCRFENAPRVYVQKRPRVSRHQAHVLFSMCACCRHTQGTF